MDLILIMFSFVILILGILVGVAFLTLLERKLLGYIEIRKGPDKEGVVSHFTTFQSCIKIIFWSAENSFDI